MPHKTEPMTWEVKFPLLTNPHIVKAWGMAMGATYLVCMLILAPMMIATGEMDGLAMLALIFLAVVAGLGLLGLGIMGVLFGNRSHARFTLSEQGVSYESEDHKARTLSRLAVLAGGLAGSPTAAGAGLLSISKERVHLSWAAVYEARYDDRHLTIRLRNQWRDLLHLYCTPDTYDTVRDVVRAKVSQKGDPKSGAARSSPLPGALLSTLLVVAACLPLYALGEIAALHLLIPLLIMLFSLAMVWMIPLFAWAVLPLAAYIPVHLVWTLSRPVTIKLVSTYTYRRFELLDAGEWILIGLAVAGLCYLSRISVRSLKGRYIPVLMRDQQGAEQGPCQSGSGQLRPK